MNSSVGSVTNADSAASAAHAQAQSYFNNNLFRAVVNIVQNATRTVSEIVQSVAHNARGGFVNEEQLSWLAEGNKPEVVIPLATSERTRAIDLFKRTAAILGANDVAYLPSLAGAGAGSSVNYGGINVVINAAEGQSEESIADAVIDRIQSELTRRER
jgi:SLT domain-containing protein